MSSGFRSEGTVVQQNENTYWFKDDFIGKQVPTLHAMTLVEGIVGRKLTDFEFKLLISRPFNGSRNITIVSMLVNDPSEHNYLRSVKSVVIGYAVRHRENSARYNYGDVIGTDAFYDTDGNLVGEVKVTRKQEPPLETPLLDPIDFVGGALADIVRNGAKALLRGAMAGIEERLLARGATPEMTKLATLTAEELKAVRGGAASVKPPMMSADVLNKPVPQIKLGMGPKRMLTRDERTGVMKILGALERVRNGDSWAWAELIPNRPKQMQFGTWAKQGWNEIDVLAGNPGAYNQMRVLVRVAKGDIEAKLMQMH